MGKNVYCREITLQRAKIKNKIIFCFPDVVFFVISIYKKSGITKFRKVQK